MRMKIEDIDMETKDKDYIGTEADNMQKYLNYKIQMGRLNKAIKSEFYLEAIFIEYAVLEDRVESILRHGGTFRPNRHNTLNSKLNRLEEMQRNKKGPLRKYLSDEFIAEIRLWRDKRNQLMHAMMKRTVTKDEIAATVDEGREIIKRLNSKVSSYSRAVEKL